MSDSVEVIQYPTMTFNPPCKDCKIESKLDGVTLNITITHTKECQHRTKSKP